MEEISLSLDYFNELKETTDYKRLKELKSIIDNKYSKEIIAFKTLESKYNDLLKYNDEKIIKEAKDRFIDSKIKLYSKEEIKEYFEIQNKLDIMLKNDFNDIKKSISVELSKTNKCK